MDRYPKDHASSLNISPIHISENAETAGGFPRSDAFHTSTDASLFSSSLPVLRHEKSNFTDSEHSGRSIDDDISGSEKLNQEDDPKGPLRDIEPIRVGSLLPGDEDELLAGIMDDFDLSGLPTQLEDLDDDFFGSGGGMELDFESQESLNMGMSQLGVSDGVTMNGVGVHFGLPNGIAAVAGEHPYGEHPSRTLFVRNINSNVEDSELKSLFEQYGDIRTLYTACKHRGFVMISYYDIRSARTAMRALQNKPLRRRKLDIHFSIPKDNPSEKDINQGTLVVFNLDASVSNDDLRIIFGAYGEVKEIRETPHKRHHKFIEFYDVRAAEAALKALNRSDIAGKRIKLEPSRPGGARRNLMQQLSQELDQDESRTFLHQVGSPITNSPPGNWSHFGSPAESSPLQGFNQFSGLRNLSPVNSNNMPGLASILSPRVSNSPKIAPIGKDHVRTSQTIGNAKPTQGLDFELSRSFPEQKLSGNSGPNSSFGESNSVSTGIGTLSGPQFLWGSPTLYSEQSKSSSAWPTSSVGNPFRMNMQGQNNPYSNHRGSILGSHNSHHIGSAPSNIPINSHFGFFPESPETSFMNPNAIGGMGLNRNNPNYLMNMGVQPAMGIGVSLPGNITDSGSTSSRIMPLQRNAPIFFSNGSYQGIGMTSSDGLFERSRSRRMDYSMNQIDNKKQFHLDLEKIRNGKDSRTTLMIKNIPNKYTSKMLLVLIDEFHKGTYDFLYLPIDFKNKCNVGYAFINMVSPSHIPSFYEAFNGKKWEKFNSEKVASLAYARIQGKAALVTHFQNSSLMNEDKRCRPIVFQSEGQEISDEELFLSSNLNICIRQPDGSYSGDLLESPKGYLDESPEKSPL